MTPRTKRLLFYSFFIVILMLIVSPFLFYWGVNLPPVRKYISEWIQTQTQQKARIKDYELVLIPHPGLKVSKIEYRPGGQQKPFFIDSLFLSFDSRKLLQGKLVVDQIVVDHPSFPGLKKSSSSLPDFFVFDTRNIRKWLDKIIFPYFPKSQESIQIGIKNFSTSIFKSLEGNISISKKTGKIFSSIELKQLKIAYQNCPEPIRNSLRFSNLSASNVKFKASITPDNKLSANVIVLDFNLSAQKQPVFQTKQVKARLHMKDDLIKAQIKEIPVTYPAMTLGALFSADFKKKESFVQFTASDLNIDETRDAALRLITPNEITQNIFKIVKTGHCPKITVEFKGKTLSDLFDGHRMVLAGQLQKGLVHIPQTSLAASDVNGSAHIKNGVLYVDASDGKIMGSQIKSGDLKVDLLNFPDYPFSGSFLIDVDLSLLPQTLISLLPETVLAQELKKVHHIKGRSQAVLDLDFESLGDLQVGVKSKPFSVTGEYQRIPEEISIKNIVFEYSSNTVKLKDVTANINHNLIENFSIEIQLNDDFDIDLKSGPTHISLVPTIKWLNQYPKTRTMIFPLKKGSGDLWLNRAAIKGPLLTPEKWDFDIEGKVDHVDLSTADPLDEIKALSLDFNIRPAQYQIKGIDCQSVNHHWLTYFAPSRIINQIKAPIAVHQGQIFINPEGVRINAQLNATWDASADIKLSGQDLDSLSLEQISLKDREKSDATLKFLEGHHKFNSIDFKGKISTASLLKFLNPKGSWADQISTLTAGKELLIDQMDSNRIHIKTKALDLSSIFSHSEGIKLNSNTIPERTVFLNADTVQYKKLQFTNVKSKIILSKDGIYLRLLNASLCELNTKGYINYEKGRLYTNFPITAENNDNAQSLLSCLLDKQKFMDGRYSFKADLSSNSLPSQIKQSLNGQAVFTAKNGRIYKLTLLSRILSVLNVSNVFKGKIPDLTQQGFAYKKVEMTFDIENSIINIDKGIIDGVDMTMIFEGSIDPVNDKINVTCLVAPFKTVDMIIEKIPIISTLLGGRLVSVPVQATGKLSDPHVIPLHPSAVGSGLINMMTTILKTPITLFDKLSKSGKDEKK